MSSDPLVSVIVPAFNAQDYIAETIESVISQSYRNVEVCVVDDGSTDNTSEAIKAFGSHIRYFYQKNSGGCSIPRNTGINNCLGDLITFIDSDDVMTHSRIEQQVDFLQRHKNVSLVFCDYKDFNSSGLFPATHFQECPKWNAYLNGRPEAVVDNACEFLSDENFGISGTYMLKRCLLGRESWFDPSLKACEDFHFYYRLARLGPVGIINSVGMLRRLHDNNMTKDSFKMLTEGSRCFRMLLSDETNIKAIAHLKNNLSLRWSCLGRKHADVGCYAKALTCEFVSFVCNPSFDTFFLSTRGSVRALAMAIGLYSSADR